MSLTLGWPSSATVRSADTGKSSSQPNVEIYPSDPLDLGKQYVKEKRYELAVETYTKALQGNTERFDLYVERSHAYLKLKRYSEALADAESAIKDSPHHPRGYVARGLAAGLSYKYEESIANFTKAIELSPSTAQLYAMRGAIHLDFGHFRKAVDDLSLAIQMAKGVVSALVFEHRAMAFRQLGRYEDALGDLSESLRKDPSWSSSQLRRGSVYRCLKKYELAKLDLDEVIKREPDNLEAHLQRAFVSMDQNDYQSAFKDLEHAHSNGMKDPHLFLSLAYAHYRLGNISEALTFNDKATTLFPDKLQATATLQKGIFLLASGKVDAGRKVLSVGQGLAMQEKDLVSVEDTLDDLGQLEAQGLIESGTVKRNRDGLMNTLKSLRSLIGVRHKCQDP